MLVHSSRPYEIRKSFDVLSAPLPVAEPRGRGAGMRPQLPLRILSASTQYFSPDSRPSSMLSAASLNRSAAALSALSLPPIVSWALNPCTETMGEGFETTVAARGAGGRVDGWDGSDAVSRRESKSLAWVISPSATLPSVKCMSRTMHLITHYS